MKKPISLLLALSLCAALCACGSAAAKEEPAAVPDPYAKYTDLVEALEAGNYEQARAIIEDLDPAPPAAATPIPYVESVKILYFKNDLTGSDFTMKLSQGEDGDITLSAEAYPKTSQSLTFTWSVDREGILELTPNEDGSECRIHQVGVLENGVVITLSCAGASGTVRCLAFE